MSVHDKAGVVVHTGISAPSGHPCPGRMGRPMVTEGEVVGSYSTSASASAVAHDGHQNTGFTPR